MRPRNVLVGVGLFVGCAAAAAGLWAADQPPAAANGNPFENKVLLVHSRTAGRADFVMQKPQLVKQADRWFLVGKAYVLTLGDPVPAKTWFPMDDVAAVEEFATVAELDQYVANSPPPRK